MHTLDLRRRIILIVIVISLIGLAAWYLFSSGIFGASGAASLQASGTVEATAINMAPELSGRVVEVLVDKGDQVSAGDPLFRLDGEMLQTQRRRAVTLWL